jgi:hypothetical protein
LCERKFLQVSNPDFPNENASWEVTVSDLLTIPQIQKDHLPLDRHTLIKLFIQEKDVLVAGRVETVDARKVSDGEPWRRYRKLLVPRAVLNRVIARMRIR